MCQKLFVIERATDMFIREGVKAVRMDDIATSLSISKRTLYKYFKDKETLLVDCVRYYNGLIKEKQRAAVEGIDNVIEALMINIRIWEGFAKNNYKLMSSLHKFYPKIFEELSRESHEEGGKVLRQELKQGIEQGLFLSDINIDLSITVFSYSIYGLFELSRESTLSNISREDAFKYVITYFFRGIATTKGIEVIDMYMKKQEEN